MNLWATGLEKQLSPSLPRWTPRWLARASISALLLLISSCCFVLSQVQSGSQATLFPRWYCRKQQTARQQWMR